MNFRRAVCFRGPCASSRHRRSWIEGSPALQVVDPPIESAGLKGDGDLFAVRRYDGAGIGSNLPADWLLPCRCDPSDEIAGAAGNEVNVPGLQHEACLRRHG